jgi:hypothetical protein
VGHYFLSNPRRSLQCNSAQELESQECEVTCSVGTSVCDVRSAYCRRPGRAAPPIARCISYSACLQVQTTHLLARQVQL